tara:strand:- start:40 stop:1011 length:972 start_codon:yes stop_codon:yes gene_type:complete
MTRLFNDEQSSSLITSMMNPESNASKFIEQGEDIGLPRDVTMDILNKYATYGANTGIGNLGGERLVNALNEEYRKRVDAPLQSNPPEMFLGGGIIDFLSKLGNTALDIARIKELFGGSKGASSIPDAAAGAAEVVSEIEQLSPYDQMLAKEVGLDALNQEAVNSPVTIEPPTGESVLATEQAGRLEKFQKYLDENPVVARQLASSGQDLAKILGQAIGRRGDDERRAPIRAVRPRFQAGQVRTQRIGMADGGKPEEGSVLGRKLFIQGGEVDGPGGPKEDLVPIWASDSEYVVSEKGVRNMGGGDFEKGIAALDKINFGKRNV